ncbi:Ldh family oxidoreductase [Elioraea sp. Yellowstone]|jgi:(2R)-3-sulfolactate dehydrogenase (NADP+)|uniref:Ldh family oxidoreductase n=1 Tax=Elioraea sp. Yellowstone TaxID=2592070 RepID=UPI001154783F|nr:Ldh family oxidoreductase [Elioraea sp. Yellowstone]TQF77228.1 Ldh family oxidoreductase [Elioraea sp. Yellowstone]
MSTETLSFGVARALAASALRAAGARAEAAHHTAEALARADLDGIASHGLSRVPAYVAQLRAGKVKGDAVPSVTRPAEATVAVDAADGLAYPAIAAALAWAASLLPQRGVIAAGVRNSHHAGALGLFVEDLARTAGAFAIAFTNSPAGIAPAGSGTPLFGTNPIAFACPMTGRDPLVIDLSLSMVARGRIMVAAQKGEPIPEGWATDAAGRPTTDARAALAGAMLPIGGAKGAALVLMVELLTAALTASHAGFEASSFFDDKGGPPRIGQLFLAIRPGAVGADEEAVSARVAAITGRMLAEPGVRLPGDRRLAIRARQRAEGIRYPVALLAELRALAG